MEVSEHIDDHILSRYKIIQKIGKGAYGIVWKAVKRDTNEVVALKKIFDAFRNSTDAQRTYREIMFLQKLKKCPNIVKLRDVYPADNNRDVYLVFEYVETDLHAVIRSNILEEVHKRYILYQLLKAIHFIHTGDLLHRDLKPSNVLLNNKCNIKLADFGLARSVAPNNNSLDKCLSKDNHTGTGIVMTDYVATRWYRAPEILVGSTKYTKGVDMWAIGCIFAEMLIGKPMFPGSSTINQLAKVITFTGMPSEEDMESLSSPFTKVMISSLNTIRRKNIKEYFPNTSEECLDLLSKLLQFNPTKRINTVEALSHPYLSNFHKNTPLPRLSRAISIPVCDNVKYDLINYRHLIYKFIQSNSNINNSLDNTINTVNNVNSGNTVGTVSMVSNSVNTGNTGNTVNLVDKSVDSIKNINYSITNVKNMNNSNGIENNFSQCNLDVNSVQNNQNMNLDSGNSNLWIKNNSDINLNLSNTNNTSNMSNVSNNVSNSVNTVNMVNNSTNNTNNSNSMNNMIEESMRYYSINSNEEYEMYEKGKLSVEYLKAKNLGSILKPIQYQNIKPQFNTKGQFNNKFINTKLQFNNNKFINNNKFPNKLQFNNNNKGQVNTNNKGQITNNKGQVTNNKYKGQNFPDKRFNTFQHFNTYNTNQFNTNTINHNIHNTFTNNPINNMNNMNNGMIGMIGMNKEFGVGNIFPLCKFVPKKQERFDSINQ
ncbi:protein kinase, putative [Theileria annulata]|uniref:Mitogen-activated protein kinase n=1 Tax=Theileria annulata TaxID=5874 RepID=Q4UHL2_THEAN|nr:protein kinase, putative [Theileria annulata]CAI73427.1 protein kinase, putative [Theileria annulata]|eukprot:XP_954104.1 protein kinase, putative [Theileria annulata]